VTGASDVIHRAFGPDDSYQTYLPLAHIIEFVMENCCLYWGAVMGYGTPKTLTDASVRNCKGDLREFKPTILAGVPAVWESVRKGVVAKVAAGGPLLNAAFWGAFYAKEFLITNNLPGSSILDQLIFAKVKEATGGKLRLCLSGGGPIARETQRFISMVVSTIINGYGLTETTRWVICGV
jgi:long-chain acyl-CoA synthetase